jgi:hypothetical protein
MIEEGPDYRDRGQDLSKRELLVARWPGDGECREWDKKRLSGKQIRQPRSV